MRIREHLKRTLLTSAIAVSPVMVFAADGQFRDVADSTQLQAADNTVVLRQVPKASTDSNTVQQVLYQEATSDSRISTVGAELEQVFRENGQPLPSMQPRRRPTAPSQKIRLVQHAESGQDQTERARKPSFIRRWFGKLTGNKSESSGAGGSLQQGESSGSDDNPYLNSGQPTRKLPAPPPINYNTTRGGSPNGAVPAQSTGYQPPNSQMQAVPAYPQRQNGVQPLIQNGGAQPNYQQPTINRPGAGGYQPSQKPARQIPRDDGFIDPFGGQGLTRQEETILDLDSLIEGPEPVAAGAQNQLTQNYSEAEELLPELSVEPATISRTPARGAANGPFTGYRLDTDEQIMQQPTVKPAASVQPVREVEQQAETRTPEPLLPVVEDTLDLTVPLIEDEEVSEPDVELPPAEMSIEPVEQPETAFEEIPLLETADDEPEQWEPTPKEATPKAIEEQDAARTSDPEQEFRAAHATDTQLDTARIHVLDSRARQEQQRYRIMARTGKTGFKGFCPVTLRDQRELTDSREQHKAKFGLQTYYFASPEAKSAFEANPSRYAPAAGGSDVVLLVNTGEDTPGALDFSLWYRDRLYMFRSRETQAIFSKNPVQYANQY